MKFEDKLSNYAALIVRHGMNVQPGQVVNVDCEVIHRELVYLVAREAYRAGAKLVQVDYGDPRLVRLRIENGDIESLSYVPSFVNTKYKELLTQGAANLKIAGSENPDILAGQDPVKVNTMRKFRHLAVKEFFDHGIGESKVAWCVVGAATPMWAKKVFPELGEREGVDRLWDEIFRCCRVDSVDFLYKWRKHNEVLHNRGKQLSSLKINSLHFTGPGTDLKVGLSPCALFKGGTESGPRNVQFEPNLPTEECFTTPDYRLTSGKVRITRPIMMNGMMIRGLNLVFKEGQIIDFKANEGQDTFREYISSDEGGARLGEVALVGIDSPIYQSGLVFEEILYDENAACHIAVGAGFRFCIKGSATMTSSQLAAIGFNESTVHCDMMISSSEVDLSAETAEHGNIKILVKGVWQPPF